MDRATKEDLNKLKRRYDLTFKPKETQAYPSVPNYSGTGLESRFLGAAEFNNSGDLIMLHKTN